MFLQLKATNHVLNLVERLSCSEDGLKERTTPNIHFVVILCGNSIKLEIPNQGYT